MEKMEASNLEVKYKCESNLSSKIKYFYHPLCIIIHIHPKSILTPGCNPLASKQRDVLLLGVVGEELPLGHRLVHQAPSFRALSFEFCICLLRAHCRHPK